MRSWVPVVLLAALLGAGAGCQEPECGPGTYLREGRCVAVDRAIDGTDCVCGELTHFDLVEGRCVLDSPPAVCEPGTWECTRDAGPSICAVATGPEGCL